MTDAESEKRFEGGGQEFHGKYLGVVDVAKSKGQEVCQEAMQKLLVALKSRKEPKPRLIINLSFEGTRLKEMPPGINLMDMTFKHSQVSYVWKDPRDQRSLGIVRSEVDPEDASKIVHKFHGIRTIKPAMPFLQEMQELFRIVKERSTLQKERTASMAATAVNSDTAVAPTAATPAAPAAAAQPTAATVPAAAPEAAVDLRDRAVSNLLGPDLPAATGLTKNASVASLEDLGDIFSASATISQPALPTLSGAFGQPMGGGGAFGQPMVGGGAFGQPTGGGGAFGQPMGGGGGAFGQPIGVNPYSQPIPSNPYAQPIGAPGAFGQPAVINPFGQPIAGNGPIAQPIGGSPFGQVTPTNPFGQQTQPQPQPVFPVGQPAYALYGQRPPVSPFSPQPQQQPPQFYSPQPQQFAPVAAAPSTNPFAAGFTSVFDRQNSVPAGDLLTPVTLTPLPSSPVPGAAAAKPDAFGDLLVGLAPSSADPKRQQVSGKELFKPTDKPKASLRDLANQSPRPN